MTSTSSAAATGLPDRRHFLSTVAVAAVGTLSLPCPVSANSGDAHLLDLGRRLAQMNALAAKADRQLTAVSRAYDRACPDVEPDALFVRSDDDLGLRTFPEKKHGKLTGRHIYSRADIETAATALTVMSEQDVPGGDDPKAAAKWARIREIVASHTARREARRAAWRSCGMTQAEAAASAAHERCKNALLEIAQCPATTPAGVYLKARAAMFCFGETADEAEEQIDDVMAEMSTGETLALSILKDVARMAERASA